MLHELKTELYDLELLVQILLSELGSGNTGATAYQTAWIARLSPNYHQFEGATEWLRRHQYDDGSWGAPLVHHHDRIISTLAAMIALHETGHEARDKRRVHRAEQALWKYVGYLHHDQSDTVAFPILAGTLTDIALSYGFDVPRLPTRNTKAFSKKVGKLLASTERNWRATTLVFSLEGLPEHFTEKDALFEENGSICISPSATAAYLMRWHHPVGVTYLEGLINAEGGVQALAPIDIFDIVWSLTYLRMAGVITPDDSQVRTLLDYLYARWSPQLGVSTASYFPTQDSDDSAACLNLLRWGGYPVTADFYAYYEQADHFSTYLQETNPSVSANVRLLAALRYFDEEEDERVQGWKQKIVVFLRDNDENGSYWWDKWHASPYYVNSTAVTALTGLDDTLAASRLRWILRTQRDDGGWGYLGISTPEETGYCILALIQWQRQFGNIDPMILEAGGRYLHNNMKTIMIPTVPLWISKELYTPINPARSAALSALYALRDIL